MQQVAEQLHALDEARPGAREVRGRVDRHHAGAERGQPLALLHRLRRRLLRVVAAGHRDDHLGGGGLELGPVRRARLLARGARARPRRPRARSSAGPSGRRRRSGRATRARPRAGARRLRPPARPPRSARPHPRQAPRRPRRTPAACASRGTSASTSPRVVGSSEITSGCGGQPVGHRPHVVERDRADLADRLRHDQVHVELLAACPRRARRGTRRDRCARAPRRRSRRPAGPLGSRCG